MYDDLNYIQPFSIGKIWEELSLRSAGHKRQFDIGYTMCTKLLHEVYTSTTLHLSVWWKHWQIQKMINPKEQWIQVKALPYNFLFTRHTEIQSRLSSIATHNDTNSNADNTNDNDNGSHESKPLVIPSIPKTDTHWDFIMNAHYRYTYYHRELWTRNDWELWTKNV